MSKLGLAVKTKLSPTCDEIKKLRIVLDNKQSGVSLAARRTHKSTLRSTHAIHGCLGMMNAQADPGAVDELITLLMADITDTF